MTRVWLVRVSRLYGLGLVPMKILVLSLTALQSLAQRRCAADASSRLCGLGLASLQQQLLCTHYVYITDTYWSTTSKIYSRVLQTSQIFTTAYKHTSMLICSIKYIQENREPKLGSKECLHAHMYSYISTAVGIDSSWHFVSTPNQSPISLPSSQV